MCPIRQKNEERKELEANKTTSHEKQEANKLAKNDFSNSPKPTTTRFEEFLKLADIMTLLLIFSPSLFTPSWILRRSSAQYYSNKQSQEGQPRVELVDCTPPAVMSSSQPLQRILHYHLQLDKRWLVSILFHDTISSSLPSTGLECHSNKFCCKAEPWKTRASFLLISKLGIRAGELKGGPGNEKKGGGQNGNGEGLSNGISALALILLPAITIP